MVFLAFAESIQLVPDGTIFFHIAIILLMVFVLNRTLFRPINRILEERERHTRGRVGEAHDILLRIEENMSRYERTMRDVRAEGYQSLEQQRSQALAERQQRLNIVKEDLSRQIETEREAIRAQSAAARANLLDDARRVAATVSAQILGRTVSNS